jgi:DNA primase
MHDSAVKDQVKEATDIVAVISQFVALKRRGVNYVGLCPFHTEKTPSFSVHGDRQFFHCFGCGKGGDVFTFLMEHEGWNFPEALKYCADRAGIRLPQKRDDDDEGARRRRAMRDALTLAQDIFKQALFSQPGQSALDYLHGRGYADDTLRRAGLGYAPPAYDTLMRSVRARGLSERALLDAGLALQSEKSTRPYDRFRNRITFPIVNLSGNVVGFGARAIAEGDEPKYMNSPETDVYHKGKVLYGLYAARETIRRQNHAFVVEGYLDWLTMFESGIENVVAVSGTALTLDQAKLLARFCERITLVYDSDLAGQRATLRGIDVAFNAGLRVDVATLPEGEDPDSLIRRQGRESFAKAVAAAPTVLEYRVDRARAESGGLDFLTREKLAKEFAELAALIEDATRRAAFLSEASGLIDIPETQIRSLMGKLRGASPSAVRQRAEPEVILREEEFLRVLMEDPVYIERARTLVVVEDFEDVLLRQMYQRLLNVSADGRRFNSPADLDAPAEELTRWARLLVHTVDPRHCERIFADVVAHFHKRRLRARVGDIKRAMIQAQRAGDSEAVERLMEEYEALTRAPSSSQPS